MQPAEAIARARAVLAQPPAQAEASPANSIVSVLDESDECEAVALLTAAFSGRSGDAAVVGATPEPVFEWALGGPRTPASHDHRLAWYRWYMRWVLLTGLQYGLVIGLKVPGAAPPHSVAAHDARAPLRLVAVAVVIPPGHGWTTDTSSWSAITRPHIYKLAVASGGPPPDEWRKSDYAAGTSARMKAIGSAAVRARLVAKADDGWHLYACAVAPEHQRTGCARALLRALARVADADGLDCVAESASPRMRELLSRAGYAAELDATPKVARACELSNGVQPPEVVLMRRRPARLPPVPAAAGAAAGG